MKKDILLIISNYSYFLMMFFLPISLLLDNIFLCILLLSIILQSKKAIKNNVLYFLIFFYIYTMFNGLINNFFLVEQQNYIKLLPLILIPFCLQNIDYKIKLKGLFFLAIGILVIQINSVYGIINYYYFTDGKKYALNNYSKINEILNYERPYLGFFSLINIIICFFYFSILKKKIFSSIVAFFSIFLIIVISARLAFIVLFLLLIIAFLKKMDIKNIAKIVFFSIGVGVLLFVSNNSLKDRFSQLGKDARVITWKGASEIFHKNANYFFGSGSEENTREKLLEYYKSREGYVSLDEKNRFINNNYNTHNQYINEILKGGLLGLLLFIIPQLVLLYNNFKKNNSWALMFLVSIMSFCFVENILNRQVGVYLYAIVLSLTSITFKLENND